MGRSTICLAVLLAGCSDDAAPPPPAPTLTLVTWNVLADEPAPRLPALMAALRGANADVIALQEVTPAFIEALEAEAWAKPYHTLTHEGRPTAAAGLFILSRWPFEEIRMGFLPGRGDRGVVVGVFRAHGRRIAVGTVHLESALDAGPLRAQQLDKAWTYLGGADDAFLMGDFNVGDGAQPETAHLRADFADAWPGGPPTWNIEKNPMAKRNSFSGEASRRIDRILVKSDAWRVESARLLGDAPVEVDLFPSDHFGVVATLKASR